MDFILTLNLDNAAMHHEDDDSPDVYALGDRLRHVADRVEQGELGGDVKDINGNTIGTFTFRE
jgi:hypothetical protein